MSIDQKILDLVTNSQSPSRIAHLRATLLRENVQDGHVLSLASLLAELLTVALDGFFALDLEKSHDLAVLPETRRIFRLMEIHANCCEHDIILSEELGRQGTHAQLMRVIKYRFREDHMSETCQDVIMGLQDTACSIAASYGGKFPVRAVPFTFDELQQRLPLLFDIVPIPSHSQCEIIAKREESLEAVSILINQVTKRQAAQEDVGFVMWPSAVVLARWLASSPQLLNNSRHVLEIGAGCGLSGLVAARILQKKMHRAQTKMPCEPTVILSDFNPSVVENLKGNISLNNLTNVCTTVGLDFYQQPGLTGPGGGKGWLDMNGMRHDPVDVVLGADMISQPSDAVAASRTIHDALRCGGLAYIVCATAAHRFGVDIFPEECKRMGLTIAQELNMTSFYEGALLNDGLMEKTSGYVDGMELTMWKIEKPVQ